MMNRMTIKTQDYRDLLKTELLKRQKINPSYSLRAFARDLEIAGTQLSQVLLGKRGISAKSAQHIAKRLRLSPLKAEYFYQLVLSQQRKGELQKQLALKKLHRLDTSRTKELEENQFKAVSDWKHFGCLELLKVKKQLSPDALAQRLGGSFTEINEILKRLKSLGLIEKKQNPLEVESRPRYFTRRRTE